MFTTEKRNHCLTAKNEFSNKYTISSFTLAPMLHRMVYAGGAFASILLSERPRDIDLFILSSVEKDYRCIDNFLSVNKWKINQKFNKDNLRSSGYPINEHIEQVWKCTSSRNNFDYDIIFTDYSHDKPEEVVNNFDYMHCKVWYHSGRLNLTEKVYNAIVEMKLIPSSDIFIRADRKKKFIDRGWKADK